MINVKDPPFNAVGDGVTPDDDAFACALDWLRTHPPFDAKVLDPSSAPYYQGAQRLYIPAGVHGHQAIVGDGNAVGLRLVIY